MAKISAGSPYSVHPSYAMEEAYRRKLVENTGRDLDDWVALVKEKGPRAERDRREWLKIHHGLTTNYAWWIAERADGRGGAPEYDPEGLVEAMFSGKKAILRPIYERLLVIGRSTGPDVRVCPGKTIVPFYRKHVFAEVKPATLTRIDIGFALRDTPCTGRLVDTGGFLKKDRITHRIPISDPSEVDEEVARWMRAAYEMDV